MSVGVYGSATSCRHSMKLPGGSGVPTRLGTDASWDTGSRSWDSTGPAFHGQVTWVVAEPQKVRRVGEIQSLHAKVSQTWVLRGVPSINDVCDNVRDKTKTEPFAATASPTSAPHQAGAQLSALCARNGCWWVPVNRQLSPRRHPGGCKAEIDNTRWVNLTPWGHLVSSVVTGVHWAPGFSASGGAWETRSRSSA